MPTSKVHPAGAAAPAAKASARKPVAVKAKQAESPSALIDAKIAELGDWRGEMLSRLRTLLKEADPDVVEEWKWGGTPVWSHSGLICTGETYKNVVKMTYAKGASLPDPSGLFNSSLEDNVRRAIDVRQGWVVLAAFAALLVIGAAILLPSHGQGTFVVYSSGLSLLLVAVCCAKGEPPAWRWGDK